MKNVVFLGWTCYFFMIFLMAATRASARESYKIWGFLPEDFFSCLVMYPFAASQMGLHAMYVELPAPASNGNGHAMSKDPEAMEIAVNQDPATCSNDEASSRG